MRRVKRCFAKAKQRYEPFDIIIRFRHSQNNVELSSSGNIISVFRARRAQRASPVLKYLNFGGNTSLPEVVKLELGTYLLANVLLNINTPSPTIENLILQIAGKCTAVSSLPSVKVCLAAVSDQNFFIRPHGCITAQMHCRFVPALFGGLPRCSLRPNLFHSSSRVPSRAVPSFLSQLAQVLWSDPRRDLLQSILSSILFHPSLRLLLQAYFLHF